ncbi:hypothetical protein G4H71_12900 [Rhodococcus triatomae]|uniref:hypothetical protein n=1 Tax=Rhodococcus triatomae TaxID=300028 RepID=UPI000AABFF4E|nr:hypothetical protein [Rhodococcus triatomae]QNG20286.1 hypothetical protein G4H72_17480 [Rhodococcus triatomae]QNG23799.1 hypothetical protein G4H71_12900 [Rhodococcus triatomae]
MLWVWIGLGVWAVLSVPVAVIVGRSIARADRIERRTDRTSIGSTPGDHDDTRHG